MNALSIIAIILIDFILIWLWVCQMDPDPSVSIGIILLIPMVFIINLLIAGILFLFKKKEFAKLFLLNAFMASVIINYLFGKGIDRHQRNAFDSWEFSKADTVFSIIRYKEDNEFNISYSLDPGSSWEFLTGKYQYKNRECFLLRDSSNMKITDDILVGFRSPTDTIRLKKIER